MLKKSHNEQPKMRYFRVCVIPIGVLALASCGEPSETSGAQSVVVADSASAVISIPAPVATYGPLLESVVPRLDDDGVVVGTVLPDGETYTCEFDPFMSREEAVAGCDGGARIPAVFPMFDSPAGLGVGEVKRSEVTDDYLRFHAVIPALLSEQARFYIDRQMLGISATDTAYGKMFAIETPAREELQEPDRELTPGVRQLGDAANQGWTYLAGKNRVLQILTSEQTRITLFVQGTDQSDASVDEIFKQFTS